MWEIIYNTLDILFRIQQMFLWTCTFDVAGFVDEMEKEYINAQNTNNYGPAVCSYYSHMGDLIHNFYGKFWHFSPWSNNDRVNILHCIFAESLDITSLTKQENFEEPSKKGLELGCGFGHTVGWMKEHTNSDVQGITLSQDEVLHAQEQNLNVSLGDYHNIHFSDEKFDFVYAIYCLKYSNNLDRVFAEVSRVLKPRGKFLSYEILTTENFNENNSLHKQIRDNICRSTNMPPLHSIGEFIDCAAKYNMSVTIEDLSETQGDVPWYYPFFLSMGLYRILKSKTITWIIERSEDFGLIPKKASLFYKRHIVHPPIDFVEGGRMGIITGSTLMIFTKNDESSSETYQG